MNAHISNNNSWANANHYIHNTSTDTLTTLPAIIYPNAVTVTVGLKGNEEHTGTPSPQNPVMPNGTGDMSSNILTAYKENYSIDASGVEIYNNVAMIYKASVSVASSTFVLSFGGLSEGDTVRIHAYTGDTWKKQIAAIAISQVPVSFTVSSDVDNIRVSIRKTATDVTLTDGQFKIPISSANTTTPVYLGEVETTRKIKKYVFTGEENGTIYSTGTNRKGIEITGITGIIGGNADIAILAICTHYQPNMRNALYRNTDNGISNAYQNDRIIFYDASCQTVEAFQQFCTQQYANGTPVTVWYVLATEETGIVNEPLMKIGDYADEVSGISIPTTAGANTLSVDTTLQPSEMSVTYHGWHPVQSVHERENGQWD